MHVRPLRRPAHLMIAAVAVAAPLLMAAPAHADPTGCETPVIDATDGKVLDAPKVSSRVTELRESTGADVYVRAFQTTPGGSAAAWWQQAYRNCPAWLGADGQTPKPNLIVVQFGLDRTNAIQYGSNFHQLDPQVDRFRAGMGTHLRSGDFTGAVTSTLTSLGTALSALSAAGAGAPASESKPVTEAVSSGLGSILKLVFWAVGLCLAFILLLVGSRLVGDALERRRVARERAEHARNRLETAREEAASAVLDSDLSTARLDIAALADANPEAAISMEPIDALIGRRDKISSDFTRSSTRETPDSATATNALADEFVQVTDQLRKIASDADKLVKAAKADVAACAPEAKRADLESERSRVLELREITVSPHVDLTEQRAALDEHSTRISALIAAIDDAKTVPARSDVSNVIAAAKSARSDVERAINRVNNATRELRRVVSVAADAQIRYGGPQLPDGVLGDVARHATVTSAAAAEEAAALLDSEGADLDKFTGDALTLAKRTDTAVGKADSQQAAHVREVARKAREEEDRKRREAARRRSSSYSPYGSDYSTGLVTGAMLGSMGGYHGSSSSSSSSFGGSDFGSSSGGFSGGGDFGGGSSGSW